MEMICINCPMGCMMDVHNEGGKVQVKGNMCPKGKVYAEKECTQPTRIVTSLVFVEQGKMNVVSVKTRSDIPKEKVFKVLEELKKIKVMAPIQMGQIVVGNIAETGVDIIATKEVKRK